MRLLLLSPALVLLPTSSFASSVTVTCDPPGLTIIGTDQAQCSVQVAESVGGSASASMGLDLAADPAQLSTLRTAQTASVPVFNPNTGPSTVATGTEIHFDEFLIPAGSVRPGYVILQAFSTGSSATDGAAGGRVSFYFPANRTDTAISCTTFDAGLCFPSNRFFATERPLIPITLGIPLELVAEGTLDAFWSRLVGGTGAEAIENGLYEFRFVEADGITPVAVSQTPEPANALLVSTVLLAALVLRKQCHMKRR